MTSKLSITFIPSQAVVIISSISAGNDPKFGTSELISNPMDKLLANVSAADILFDLCNPPGVLFSIPFVMGSNLKCTFGGFFKKNQNT